jgi:hypothetical protein
MTTRTFGPSPVLLARQAGFLYLLVVPLGIFSLWVASSLMVAGDATATADNLMASKLLFRLGIVSDILAALVMMAVAASLYKLLKVVDKNLARWMVILLLIGVPIAMLNKLNQFIALHLLGGADYLAVFTPEQLQALALVFLNLSSRGSNIAFIFWGLWLWPLGCLVYQSRFFPKLLGILLMLACAGYMVNSFAIFLGYAVNAGALSAIGELAFIGWLLVKGVDAEQWQMHLAKGE